MYYLSFLDFLLMKTSASIATIPTKDKAIMIELSPVLTFSIGSCYP